MPVVITTASTDDDIRQILALQQKNLAKNLSSQTIESQGFVTVEHTFDLLQRMNRAVPQTIAKDGNGLAGYALVMTKEFRQDIPVLEPMFAKLSHISYQNRMLSEYDFYVMGQICVAEEYRGQGVFDQLYQGQRTQLEQHYEICVTEIATRNTRSMKAHLRVGFEVALHYTNPKGEGWNVMVWNWRK